MTLHRRWSTKVKLPVGTEWGVPYTSSVAECMVWPSARGNKRDPYHDRYFPLFKCAYENPYSCNI